MTITKTSLTISKHDLIPVSILRIIHPECKRRVNKKVLGMFKNEAAGKQIRIKSNMRKRFTAINTRNWIDMLDKLLFQYNNIKYSTIKMTPTEASHKDPVKSENLPTFSVGDQVRISRSKRIFEIIIIIIIAPLRVEKGYLP